MKALKALRLLGSILLGICLVLFSILFYEEIVNNLNYYDYNPVNFFSLFLGGTLALIIGYALWWKQEPN